MEAIVFISLTTCAVLKIGEYPQIVPTFTCGYVWLFGLVTRLDQLHMSKNI